jgi:hypothetical protein
MRSRHHQTPRGTSRTSEPAAIMAGPAILALQRAAGNQAVARLLQRSAPAPATPAPAAPSPATGDPLTAFSEKFPEAAARIRSSPAAMKLVEECAAKSVGFGGYSEDGPEKRTTPYTFENRVYVAKAQTDPIRAMGDFLFELNNAARADRLEELHRDAQTGTIDAKTYARRKVDVEVEGMLRTGEMWAESKAGDTTLDRYDDHFYAEEYAAFKSGAKTKDQLVDDVLQWRNINAAALTNEKYYMQQYDGLRAGEPPVTPR